MDEESQKIIHNIQSNLKTMMLSKGYNMKTLSLASKLSETTARDIITGRSRHPSYETLRKLATTLGCTVREITEEKDMIFNEIIDQTLFTQAVVDIDDMIKAKNQNITSVDKAKLYLALYSSLLKNHRTL